MTSAPRFLNFSVHLFPGHPVPVSLTSGLHLPDFLLLISRLPTMRTSDKLQNAAAALLDPLFADPAAETMASECFWHVRQGTQRFGVSYLQWLAARSALPLNAVSEEEQ